MNSLKLKNSIKNSHFLAVVCLVSLTAACGEDSKSMTVTEVQPAETAKSVTSEPKKAKFVELSGKVVFKTFEGGFYAIDGDDGKKYLPLNLPEHAQKAGIKVAMQVEIKSGIMTIYNYGIPIEIQELTITDATAQDDNVM